MTSIPARGSMGVGAAVGPRGGRHCHCVASDGSGCAGGCGGLHAIARVLSDGKTSSGRTLSTQAAVAAFPQDLCWGEVAETAFDGG